MNTIFSLRVMKAAGARYFGWFFLFALTAHALDIPPEIRKRLMGEMEGKKNAAASLVTEAMDNSLDEDRYIVGGGDGFMISIMNLPDKTYTPTVGTDGDLYDNEIGLIPLGPITLKEAKERIGDHVKTQLRKNYTIRVSLLKVKTCYITVTGKILNPGTYPVFGSLHILDAIKAANGGVLPELSNHDFRHVTVKNRDTVKTYDLLKFLSRQDVDENPYVYPGDIINISETDVSVFVAGEILEPAKGIIPIAAGETLQKIVAIVRAKSSRTDSNFVILQKAGGGKRTEYKRDELDRILVHDGDLIIIPPSNSIQTTDTVRIRGLISHPGIYPIINGTSTVDEVIQAAGGPTSHGDIRNWRIVRRSKINQLNGDSDPDRPMQFSLASKFTAPVNPMVQPEIRASISDFRQNPDYALILPNPNSSPVLMNGDEIIIPSVDHFVYISGAVHLPGAYPYAEKTSFEDYIAMAGGYTRQAYKSNVYSATICDGIVSQKHKSHILPGDVLVVPPVIENKRLTTVFLPIVQTLAGVMTTILTAFIVFK